jgi:hypothetical protein
MMFNDTVPVGSYIQDIIKAPRSSKGSYQVSSKMELSIGPVEVSFLEGLILNKDASVRAMDFVETESNSLKGTAPLISMKRKYFRDGSWFFEKIDQVNGETVAKLEGDFSHWGEMPSLLLFIRLMDRSQPGEWQLDELAWTAPEEALEKMKVTMTVSKLSPYVHLGEVVNALRVRIERFGEDSTVVVSDEGRVLAVAVVAEQGMGFRLVACLAEECERLLSLEGDGPRKALLSLLEVRAGLKDASTLSAILATDVLAEQAGINPSDLGSLTVDEAILEKVFPREIPKEMVVTSVALAKVFVDGDRATITFPDAPAVVFRLAFDDGQWRFISLITTPNP